MKATDAYPTAGDFRIQNFLLRARYALTLKPARNSLRRQFPGEAEDHPTGGFQRPHSYLEVAQCRAMEGKGFSRALITEDACGAKVFSMGSNVLHAEVETSETERSGEQGWHILSVTGFS